MIELVQQTKNSYQDLCVHFRESTGWPLHFHRLERETAAEVEAELQGRGEYCWFRRVEDGRQCIGLVILNVPDRLPASSSYESAIVFAESIALLMTQLAQTHRQLSEQVQHWQAFASSKVPAECETVLRGKLHDLLSAAIRLSGYQSASLYLLNPGLNRLKLRVSCRIRSQDLPALQRDVTSSWPDLDALSRGFAFVERHSEHEEPCLPRGFQTGLSVLVQTDSTPLGTLWVYDSRPRLFSGRELEPLRAIAGHLALILERTSLLRESQSQQRVQNELRIVADHQNRIRRPNLPITCGLEATYRCHSQHEVGGDLCELIPISEQITAIVMGDVSGNSVPAALVANAVKGALRALFDRRSAHPQHPQPSVVMERLNQALETIACDHQFMSLFFGEFDASTRRMAYCSAGHPSSILLRDGQISQLEADGFLLGILDDAEYTCVEFQLQVGDIIVIYTDGISETHGSTDRLFGEIGIIDALKTTADQSVGTILNEIWTRADAFSGIGNTLKSDDRSLMVLRVQ